MLCYKSRLFEFQTGLQPPDPLQNIVSGCALNASRFTLEMHALYGSDRS